MLRGQGSWRPTCFIDASSIAMMVIGRLDWPGAVATVKASKPLSSRTFHGPVNPSAMKTPATQAARPATSFTGRAALGSSTLETIAQHRAEDIRRRLLEQVCAERLQRPTLVGAFDEDAHLGIPSGRQQHRIGFVGVSPRAIHRL